MAQWWDSGPGAEERAKKREEESKRKVGTVNRVWQKPGNTCTVTIISEDFAYFTEHNYKTPEGRWGRFVCLEGTKASDGTPIPCPFCLLKEKQEFQVLVGTCINHTGFVTKEGEKVEHVKQALVVKGQAKRMFFSQFNALQRQHGSNWNLNYSVWEIERDTNQKSPTPGIVYRHLGTRSKEKLIKKMVAAGQDRDDWDAYLAPYRLDQLCTYLEPDEAYAMLGLPFPAKGSSKAAVEAEAYIDDDIDFPTDAAGSEQPLDFLDDDIERSSVSVDDFDDDDNSAIEDYEQLK